MKGEEKSRRSKYKRFLYKSLSYIVTIILFFIGLNNVPIRKLQFSIYPGRTTIIKSEQASLLDVYYKNEKINTDVTAVQIAIWNSGKHEIISEDILEPVTIYTEPNVPILEATIRKVSRELIDLSIDTSILKQGSLLINWKILERNDGGVNPNYLCRGYNYRFKD
jgi:hypothetical protein